VVYADVVPSSELQELRRKLSGRLRPLTYNYPPYDANDEFEFHVPVARGDVSDHQLTQIVDYVADRYDSQFDEYATRITNLDGRDMMWEYDLLQDEVLSHSEATSRESWQRTESLLQERTTDEDHDRLHRKTETETCIRCEAPITSGGVQFKQRTYCDNCVDTFETVAEQGVVVRSRHGRPDHEEKPYVVRGCGEQYVEHSQIEALARGKEISDSEGVPGLFIYWRRGSHWLLDTYLDEHPSLASKVERERRKIRGQNPVTATEMSETVDGAIDVRSEGDVIIDSTVVDDSVVNRSSIGDDDSRDEP